MNLKIWHKMIIGISIPSLFTLIGGILTYSYISDVKIRHGYVQIADDLKEQVLEIRRNEKNFLLHKDVEYYRYFQDAISGLNKSVNAISPPTVVEIGKDLSLLRGSVPAYLGFADDLFEYYQQEINVVEKVREEGRKLEAFVATGKYSKDLTTSFILNLRRFEKNYVLYRDNVSYNELESALSQINNITPFCFDCVEYKEAIHDLFSTYKKMDEKVNDLQSTGNKLEETTYKIATSERQKVNSFFTRTQQHLVLALILLCILGPFFVNKTASYIVAPIKRLAEITKKISEGDLTLRAPLKEHDETHTLALSFNTMLDQLQLTHESLGQSLELLHAKQIEVEKRASLGFLVSGITHELNNPLNNISLTAETMREDMGEITPEELKEYIQDILTQSERAKNIIADLLEFVGTQKTTVMEKMDIVNVIEEAIRLVANELKVAGINLKTDLPNSPFFVYGNHGKLEEVFVNIIINAIHAIKNEGTLTINARHDTVTNHIFIHISDTGHGIPEEHIKNIFEPFFTTKEAGEGTGLGLSVSQSIVREHKGEIDVESEVGNGTTFTIKLPLSGIR
jgi:signal transduction histidine kinase/CHASE3 domain sensor protein